MKETTTKKKKPKSDLMSTDGKKKNVRPSTKVPVRKKSAGGKKNPSRKKAVPQNSSPWWAVPCCTLGLLLIGCSVIMGLREWGNYDSFRYMRDSVEKQTFYNGIVVDGYDLTGNTLNEAIDFWEKYIEPKYSQQSLVFNVGDSSFCLSAEELGYISNYEEVLKNAWSAGREGTLEERYRSVTSLTTKSERFDIKRSLFDEAVLRDVTDTIADKLTYDPQNAAITGFDYQSHTFSVSDSKDGSYVDAEKLYDEACAVLLGGGGVVNVETEILHPDTYASDLDSKFGMVTSAVTKATSSKNDRLTNLALACAAINGTCVNPGETFSFNDTVGKRTKEKGYKIATVYSNGEKAEDVGGGICQVSTTLWNAAMKCDFEIVERHEHSLPVAYVDKGKDATVSWGSQDMKFKNTSDQPIYIVAYLNSEKRLYVEIYGKLLDDGMYITIEGKTTKTIPMPDAVRTYNSQLMPGEEVVVKEGHKGYKATAYRIYHSADGTELRREVLCTSYYRESAPRVEYG